MTDFVRDRHGVMVSVGDKVEDIHKFVYEVLSIVDNDTILLDDGKHIKSKDVRSLE